MQFSTAEHIDLMLGTSPHVRHVFQSSEMYVMLEEWLEGQSCNGWRAAQVELRNRIQAIVYYWGLNVNAIHKEFVKSSENTVCKMIETA